MSTSGAAGELPMERRLNLLWSRRRRHGHRHGSALGTVAAGTGCLLEYDNEGYMNTGAQSDTHAAAPDVHQPRRDGRVGKASPQDTQDHGGGRSTIRIYTWRGGTEWCRGGAKAQWYARQRQIANASLSVCPSPGEDERLGTKIVKKAVDSCISRSTRSRKGKTTITYDPEEERRIPGRLAHTMRKSRTAAARNAGVLQESRPRRRGVGAAEEARTPDTVSHAPGSARVGVQPISALLRADGGPHHTASALVRSALADATMPCALPPPSPGVERLPNRFDRIVSPFCEHDQSGSTKERGLGNCLKLETWRSASTQRKAPCRGQRISYSLQEGETLGILGESGCGKSVSSLASWAWSPSARTRECSVNSTDARC